MSNQVIALSNNPNQTFALQLTVNEASLTLNIALSFSYMAGYWQMTIYDAQGNLLLSGLPLITGLWPAANILSQYQYLNIGSCYLLNTGNAPVDYPGIDDIGQFSLLWGDNVP
jgi:hypothetical protein